MAKKRKVIRKLSQSKRAQAIRHTKLIKKRAAAARKARPKIRAYNSLLNDFIDKQIQEGKYKKGSKGLKAKASHDMKEAGIIKKLKGHDPFLKKEALKQTTRRDGVPDTVPVGETPSAYTSEAA
jgi:hypothetical protein